MPGDSTAALQLVTSVSERHGDDGGGSLGGWWKDLPLCDVWNGKLFAAQWGATTRYNRKTDKWIIYDGTRWREDDTLEIMRRAVASADSLPGLLIIGDGKNQQSLSAHRYKLLEGKTLEQMIRRARSEWPIPCTSDQFDTDPMLLPVKNGTIDLTTGELRPHRAEDMLMKQCPVEFTPGVVPEEWVKAVDLWQAGDKKMIAYVRRIVGLLLTGDVGDEAFFLLLGPSGTGKGTFVSTIEALLGPDYAFSLAVEWFLKRSNEPMAIDVHAARGMRLITVSENEKNAQFNVSKVKRWTGGDAMSGKALYQNLSNFLPTHKLLLQTNHEPHFADKALARRLKNIGFLSVVADCARKYGLKKFLRENELSGILNWALGALPGEEGLHGLADWRVNRLNTPEAVKLATLELLESQDELKLFYEEACEFGSGFEMERGEGYIWYRTWCDQTRVRRPLGKNQFIAAMREHPEIKEFVPSIEGRRRRGWQGIRKQEGAIAASGLCELCPRRAVSEGRCADHRRTSDSTLEGL